MKITKKEIKYYIITILILTFVFGFNDSALTFELDFWLRNLLLVLIGVSISFLLKQLVIELIADRYGFDYEYDFWRIRRYWFNPESEFKFRRKKFTIPFGIIIPLILTLISRGLFYFPVVGTSKIKPNLKRVGKQFKRGEGIEIAKIYLTGPLTYLFLTLFFFNIQNYIGINLDVIVLINLYLAFYGLLPLPNLEGAKIMFNSLPLYIFALAFFIAAYILLKSSLIITLIFSVLIAFLILIIYFYKYEQ